MPKKKQKKKIRTESTQEYMERGGSIEVINFKPPVQKLLYSSGHFGPKRSNRGKPPRSSKD